MENGRRLVGICGGEFSAIVDFTPLKYILGGRQIGQVSAFALISSIYFYNKSVRLFPNLVVSGPHFQPTNVVKPQNPKASFLSIHQDKQSVLVLLSEPVRQRRDFL